LSAPARFSSAQITRSALASRTGVVAVGDAVADAVVVLLDDEDAVVAAVDEPPPHAPISTVAPGRPATTRGLLRMEVPLEGFGWVRTGISEMRCTMLQGS
jgi:hypothetical protein